MVRMESAGLSHIGKKREENEDAFVIDDSLQLYVVADGMGGHQAGEVASRLTVERIQNSMKGFLFGGQSVDDSERDETLSGEANALVASIKMANRDVFHEAREVKEHHGMGSTVAAIHYADSILIAANVGDSPIYLVRNGEIERISVMHTLVEEQAAIDPERAKLLEKKYHHVLTRAIGVKEAVDADVCEMQCFDGDIAILCSDGLSNKVSPQEMLEIVRQNSPEKSCRLLVDLANDRGGDDNITVIVLKLAMTKSRRRGLQGFLLRLIGR